MSFITSLGLSFKNLLNKKGRTTLVSIAGSIGLIGIALILSISTGVQDIVKSKTTQFVGSFPIEIAETAETLNLNGLVSSNNKKVEAQDGKVASTDDVTQVIKPSEGYAISKNNLEEFKKYIDSNSELKDVATEIRYDYGVSLKLYSDKNNDYTSTDLLISTSSTATEENVGTSLSSKQYFQQISDKDEILEAYLNTINYGQGCYGIYDAAHYYSLYSYVSCFI